MVSLEDLKGYEPIVQNDNFNRWYEIYVCELSEMLAKVNEILCEMFLVKVNYEISWSALRHKKYEALPVNVYWDNVKYIQYAVKDYVKSDEGLPVLELVNA